MIYSDIKRYENSDNINYIKRALNKWQKSIRFLHSISKNELKNPPLTENIDKLISKISPEHYDDIMRYLNKHHFDIKDKEVEYVLSQIENLYCISLSIIIGIKTILSMENSGE
ncbi:MAG: hypothetical protein BWK80_16765 [Desulfobacteraceae bacterium IS3]|nr:MAG: hypothetical protein BWK80_16765 [Desulfobacteraceae bacterium IS3]